MNSIKSAGLLTLSSLLLMVSFPKWDMGYFAWVALVPLLVTLGGRGPLGGFFLAYFFGLLFFPGIFHWILKVPYYRWFHHLLLAVYFGAFSGLFGLGFGFISKRLGKSAALWAAPFLWVALEYLRGNFFFLALPWGFVGHTQYRNPAIIQIAGLLGTYSVSFLVVLANSAIASTFSVGFPPTKRRGDRKHDTVSRKVDLALILSAVLAIGGSFLYGHIAAGHAISGKSMRVAAVQGNIDQAKKWDPRYADMIMRTYSDLTLKASIDQPDIIIWPETATPGSIIMDPEIYASISALLKRIQIPLVAGSARYQKYHDGGNEGLKPSNSAVLVLPDAKEIIRQRYDKMKLFPFGEYLPQKKMIPWRWIRVSSLSEYVPGARQTIFQLGSHRFGVTICWENIFPEFVRQFVRNGAQFIVNITNEGRFGRTAAPYQLLAISVFRAVENHVFVVRCANTGVSCVIDPFGRIVKRLKDNSGQDVFVRGVLNGWVIPATSRTFYTRHGDMAAWGSLLGAFLICMYAVFSRKHRPTL